MPTIAHISDLHFGREETTLLNALVKSLAEVEPELVVVSGDITQRARSYEFLAARTFLNTLRWPLLVIAGNHDIPIYRLGLRFLSPWRKWHRFFGYELEPVVRGKDFIAMGVNTVRRAGSPLDWSRGRINGEQMETVAQCLNREHEAKLRIIVAHHPFWLPEAHSHRRVVGGHSQALKTLKEAGADIILGGHVHFAYTHLLQGLIISHAGTAVSNRVNSGTTNSFKVIKGNREKLLIEMNAWDGQRFTMSKRWQFSRSLGEWTSDHQ